MERKRVNKMAEIKLTRIKSIYGDVKGLISQIPLAVTTGTVDQFIVSQFNQTLDILTEITETDFSQYKVPDNQRVESWPEKFDANVVRVQIGRVISRLEQEYGFGQNDQPSVTPGIVIFNKNQNEISLQINYTISDLIKDSQDEESKEKLGELRDELEKPNKNWDTIKNILIWILNFSKDLFLKIIPILLEKKL